jgi:xanthine dehydrogenase YagS FAD-binding subunit
MQPFIFTRSDTVNGAVQAFDGGANGAGAASEYLAGGTTLLDLMKLDVMRPSRVVDINALHEGDLGRIEFGPQGLRLGGLVRMADAAAHPDIRKNFPVIAQSLQLAASAQLRNLASLGGNVLQRTRCTYFRDTSYAECNKRSPGSGCAALDGINRQHAVLGTSKDCIATYPGDFAQALIALDAEVELAGTTGNRRIPFATLHRLPANTPDVETTLRPGELITAFRIAPMPWARRSLYHKVRDRQSYEFALASAAVALDLDGRTARQVRIALGGLATAPWRAREAEAQLQGHTLDDDSIHAAAAAAFAEAKPYQHNAFKIELGKRTLAQALHQAAALEL